MNKKVTEPYLVDALSFTEAEARIIEEMTPLFPVSLQFPTLNIANLVSSFPVGETVPTAGSRCKLYFITSDEKIGAEKDSYQRTGTNSRLA